jgi:hypothetical protein
MHVVRTDRPGECLVNELTGVRLLSEGPREQDASVYSVPCKSVLERLEPVVDPNPGGFRRLRHLLGDAQLEPRFARTRTPNVDRFPEAAR